MVLWAGWSLVVFFYSEDGRNMYYENSEKRRK